MILFVLNICKIKKSHYFCDEKTRILISVKVCQIDVRYNLKLKLNNEKLLQIIICSGGGNNDICCVHQGCGGKPAES